MPRRPLPTSRLLGPKDPRSPREFTSDRRGLSSPSRGCGGDTAHSYCSPWKGPEHHGHPATCSRQSHVLTSVCTPTHMHTNIYTRTHMRPLFCSACEGGPRDPWLQFLDGKPRQSGSFSPAPPPPCTVPPSPLTHRGAPFSGKARLSSFARLALRRKRGHVGPRAMAPTPVFFTHTHTHAHTCAHTHAHTCARPHGTRWRGGGVTFSPTAPGLPIPPGGPCGPSAPGAPDGPRGPGGPGGP